MSVIVLGCPWIERSAPISASTTQAPALYNSNSNQNMVNGSGSMVNSNSNFNFLSGSGAVVHYHPVNSDTPSAPNVYSVSFT